MTYLEAKTKRDEIESILSAAEKEVNSFPRSAAGLVSDEVRATAEYQDAKAKCDRVFTSLRKFNTVFVKQFSKEIRNERKS